MTTPGVINQNVFNSTVINGDTYVLLIDASGVTVNVNKDFSSLINNNTINGFLINGLVTDNNVTVTQTHVLTVADATIVIESTSPAPVMVFTFTPNNATIAVSAKKVFIEKGQGGSLFITVTEPDLTVHRFSFEGVKA